MNQRIPYFGLFVGACLGLVLSYVDTSWATRNASGTYSLPAGNPVVTGTTISSTVHNATNSDLASEMTNSLDRQGRGAMLAPLQSYAGTPAAPGLTFSTDTDCGLSRTGTNTVTMSTNGIAEQDWSPANTIIHGDGGIEGSWVVGGTPLTALTAPSTPNLQLLNGAAQFNLYMKDGRGAVGNKVGRLVYDSSSEGGGTGNLVHPGWQFQSVDDTGAFVANGPLIYRGAAPSATASPGFPNYFTNKNRLAAWATVTLNNTATPTLQDGFNLHATVPATIGSSILTIQFSATGAMADALYLPIVILGDETTTTLYHARINSRTTAVVTIKIRDNTGVLIDPAGAALNGLKVFVGVVGNS